MDFLELESERLLFRKYKMEDYPVFYDMLSNLENIKYRSGEPKSEEDVREYIKWGIQCAEQKPCINFRYAIVLKETGETIGSCELAFTDKDPAELAWELHRNYWRQGYGTEIGHTLLRLGFDLLGLRRIIADCNSLNKGSYGIMEKIGMRREAHYVKYYRGNSALNHEWCDKYLYAILQEEYFAMKKEKITLCGDNCIECPRYNAQTDEELKAVAELWYKVGWRKCVVSNEEIACTGCSSHKQCTYQLVKCTQEHGVDKCNQCGEFPCEKIKAMLKRSAEYQEKCKDVCSEQEYIMLEKAFFDKENNLKK